MDLGKKILELRKNANLSQEQLAEKLNVTRQTISKWELEDTAPDIKQANKIAKLFNVSLDELLGNDTRDLMMYKITNTEKLASMTIKFLRIIGVLLLIILLSVISTVLYYSFKEDTPANLIYDVPEDEYLIALDIDPNNNYINNVKKGDRLDIYVQILENKTVISKYLENIKVYAVANSNGEYINDETELNIPSKIIVSVSDNNFSILKKISIKLNMRIIPVFNNYELKNEGEIVGSEYIDSYISNGFQEKF